MDLRETGDRPRHPWELARRDFFLAVLGRHQLTGCALKVLDGGAGDAWFATQLLSRLDARSTVTCWDAEYTPELEARMRADLPDAVHLVRDRPNGGFDLVTLLDVLEHVEDDKDFLRAVVGRSMAPGGRLLMSVPAWQPLFTSHDAFLHHHRRYSPASALEVLRGAGLKVVEQGGLFHGLLLPRSVQKARELAFGPMESAGPGIAWSHGPALTGAVLAALRADNAVSHWAARAGMRLPGLSFWALCTKPA